MPHGGEVGSFGATLGGGLQGPRDPFQSTRAAELGSRVRSQRLDGRSPGAALGRGAFGFRQHPAVQEAIRAPIADDSGGFGSFGDAGGGGGFGSLLPQLGALKGRELSALNALLRAKFGAVRTQLQGEKAGLELGLDNFIALREKQRDLELTENRRDKVRRGILDSGVFLEDRTGIEAESVDEISREDRRVTNLLGGLASQLGPGGLLQQQEAAERAVQTAAIERSYLTARLSAGR